MIQSNKKSISQRGDTITIKIKTMNGSLYYINVNGGATVASIQGQIENITGVPLGAQRLLHKAVLLEPLKYLSEYGINDGDTIQLVANMLPQQISSPSISTHQQSQVARTNALTQQNLKTKKHRYMQQRINGFTFKTQQSLETLKQNKITIDKLLSCINNKQKSMQPFVMENRQLSLGDWVDVRDVSGLWIEGQIVSKKHNFVEIHCNEYPDRYNQWIQQSSERIMPLRTQTVQSEDTPYLSPFPVNKPQIKSVKCSENTLEKLLSELPQTLRNISYLMEELEPTSKKPSNLPQFKFSFNEQQQQEEAKSFKNNRSHHSPPHSIHEQQYEYEDYDDQLIKLPIINGTQIKQSESNSIKDMSKVKNNRKQLMRSNRYIESKSSFLGYSKTKSQHEHTLNRQQTPQKNMMIDQHQKKETSVARDIIDDRSQRENKKFQEMDLEQEGQIPKIEEDGNQIDINILGSASKQQNLQIDKQENISNKGEHDDGQSSAKSFGSKRSDKFLDASSMKSLNIDTLHTHNDSIKNQKNSHGKKNIFVFDHSEAQSVKQVQNKETNNSIQGRSNYYYNQEGILEQEDSQINQQTNEEYFMKKKKQMLKRLRATQLAPLCDRLGRLLVDLAPHLATLGYQQYNQSPTFNQNLSTFTNQGSLQSRFKNYHQGEEEQFQKSSHKSNKYWSFQIPVMLTPWEIMKLNKLLADQRGESE